MKDDMTHHTDEQIAAAFSYAPKVLKQLKDAGLQYPKFELYEDASGTLILGKQGEVTEEQYCLAQNLVRSNRPAIMRSEVAIQFCCGLVVGAEETEK